MNNSTHLCWITSPGDTEDDAQPHKARRGSSKLSGPKISTRSDEKNVVPIRRAKKIVKPAAKWSNDDMLFAMEYTVDFLEAEEFGGDDDGEQVAAYRELSKRIQKMRSRLMLKARKIEGIV